MLPQWLSGKESTCNAGATGEAGSIPGLGGSSGGGHGSPLQFSCLENIIDREAWQATVHSIAESYTLRDLACVKYCLKNSKEIQREETGPDH